MRIGIVDADLIGRSTHRFPNLVCEKLSGYHKERGDQVDLLLDYVSFDQYDRVYIPKVFTDTPVPEWIENEKLRPKNVQIGGTGFYFDKAPNLKPEIEHHMPDYHLYDEWIKTELEKEKLAAKDKNIVFNYKQFAQRYREYTDYSIGFLTRGCFRKCGFCVNKKYNHVFKASPLKEFMDPERKKLCFLDDNFLGSPDWRDLLEEVIATGKQFKFKQGLDERMLTDDKCEVIFSTNYDGDITFAFDKISDYDLIESKLKMIRRHTDCKYIKFYVLVGYEGTDASDIENAFKRIELLLRYGCIPYIMRYQSVDDKPWTHSEWRGLYVNIARWCNQPSIIKKMSFREFAERSQTYQKTPGTMCSPLKALTAFENKYPEVAKKYFDVKYNNN